MPKSNKLFFLKCRKDRGRVYYVRFADEPGIWKSSGETNKDAAIQWATQHLERGKPNPSATTLASFAAGFFAEDAQGWVARQYARGRSLTQKHLTNCDAYLRNHILPQLGSRTMQSLGLRELEDCLLNNRRSAATKNKTLNALRIVFQEAKSQGIVSENIAAQLKPFVEQPKEQEVLSGEQLKKLFPRKPHRIDRNLETL